MKRASKYFTPNRMINNEQHVLPLKIEFKYMKRITMILLGMLFIGSAVQAQWSQVGQDIEGLAELDNSGWSVSLNFNGTVVAVGEASHYNNGYYAGQVRVFENNNDNWEQIGQAIDEGTPGDNFGYSVSLNSEGTIVVIGSPYNDDGGTNAGLVKIFENNNGNWIQVGQDLYGENSNDLAGWSVSINAEGNKVAIGSKFNGDNGNQSGQVRIFENTNGTWLQIGQNINGEEGSDTSGWSVSLNNEGTIVAIGAPRNNANGFQAGHVRVYAFNNETWTQLGQDIDSEAESDMFGFSVSLNSDGTILAAGGILNDGNGASPSGHVRVFEYNNGDWTQIGEDIDGEEDEKFGYSVSINDDGTQVAIGALTANGLENNSGLARVYEYNNSTWGQIGEDFKGETSGEYFGRSVSLNSDASLIAIGVPRHSVNGNQYSGIVKVFSNDVLGVSENLNDILSIYPNPSHGVLNIKIATTISQIWIYDISGKIIYNNQLSINNSLLQIDISNFENGMYIVKVQAGDLIYSTKVLRF